jgi:VWFA-related protein
MKKTLLLAVCFLAVALYPQQQPLQHVTGVTNVEVPVRVYDGDKFVDNLNLADFEVLENGVPQKVVASYLVGKTSVLRREQEDKSVYPDTHRTFYLFFEIYEYIPRIREALSYFVRNVVTLQDEFVLVTPMRTYTFKEDTLAKLSRDQVIAQADGIVRKDALEGNMEYRHVLDALTKPAQRLSTILASSSIGASVASAGVEGKLADPEDEVEMALEEYRTNLDRLEGMRVIDEKRIIGLAKYLKGTPGQKFVFLFYEREFLPLLDKKVLSHQVDRLPTNIQATMQDLFSYRGRKPNIDAVTIQKAYADSSIAIHFLYLTTSPQPTPGISYEEHSEDIFAPFLEISRATGGLAESTANPRLAMQKASEASENYYLLYYVPTDTTADGKFREIKVTVRGKSYRVMNRGGYFAN